MSACIRRRRGTCPLRRTRTHHIPIHPSSISRTLTRRVLFLMHKDTDNPCTRARWSRCPSIRWASTKQQRTPKPVLLRSRSRAANLSSSRVRIRHTTRRWKVLIFITRPRRIRRRTTRIRRRLDSMSNSLLTRNILYSQINLQRAGQVEVGAKAITIIRVDEEAGSS